MRVVRLAGLPRAIHSRNWNRADPVIQGRSAPGLPGRPGRSAPGAVRLGPGTRPGGRVWWVPGRRGGPTARERFSPGGSGRMRLPQSRSRSRALPSLSPAPHGHRPSWRGRGGGGRITAPSHPTPLLRRPDRRSAPVRPAGALSKTVATPLMEGSCPPLLGSFGSGAPGAPTFGHRHGRPRRVRFARGSRAGSGSIFSGCRMSPRYARPAGPPPVWVPLKMPDG